MLAVAVIHEGGTGSRLLMKGAYCDGSQVEKRAFMSYAPLADKLRQDSYDNREREHILAVAQEQFSNIRLRSLYGTA